MPIIFKTPAHEIELTNHPSMTLLDLARHHGLFLKSSCGGKGKCGRCQIELIEGRFLVGDETIIVSRPHSCKALSCITRVQGENGIVKIPQDALIESAGQIIDDFTLKDYVHQPSSRKYCLQIPEATIENQRSDRQRVEDVLVIQASIEKPQFPLSVLRKLPDALGQGKQSISLTLGRIFDLWSIIDIEPGDTTHTLYGIAMDIGTTTVVGLLVDLNQGDIIGKASLYNRQMTVAEDVISRISYIQSQKELDLLRTLVVDETVNPIVKHLCDETGVEPKAICRMTISGNTIMSHLLLGINPGSIGRAPFQPLTHTPGVFLASEVGLGIAPAGIVDIMPSASGYIGGDMTSDIYVSKLKQEDGLSVLIDIGTNGEIVMCEDGKMTACSTAAGPAFEGYGLYHGCRATVGAIEKVNFDDNDHVHIQVIGGGKATGICGTGVIDFIAEGLRIGLLNPRGKFNTDLLKKRNLNYTIKENNNSLKACIVAGQEDSALQEPIVMTERDISKILQAKAAIFAGMNILLNLQNKTWHDIEKLVLAGGFAKHINPTNAIAIGLLPPIPVERIEVMGNGSLAGAFLALLDPTAVDEMNAISSTIDVVELNMHEEFQTVYIDALSLPTRDGEV